MIGNNIYWINCIEIRKMLNKNKWIQKEEIEQNKKKED